LKWAQHGKHSHCGGSGGPAGGQAPGSGRAGQLLAVITEWITRGTVPHTQFLIGRANTHTQKRIHTHTYNPLGLSEHAEASSPNQLGNMANQLGQLFNKNTQSIFFNFKQKPVQRMLDFDFLCGGLGGGAGRGGSNRV